MNKDERNYLDRWREAQEAKLPLPSGLTVKVKKGDLLDLASAGGIPMPLLGAADELLEGQRRIQLEKYPEYLPVIEIVVKAVVVWPKILDAGKGGKGKAGVGIDELSTADKIVIYNWATAEVAQLAPFSGEAGGGSAAGPPRDPISDEAEPVLTHS